jgi:hypothetical protein
MKIDKVIHSSDNNPLYLDFWSSVSKVWKEKFNVEPVLVYIDDEDVEIDDSCGSVIRIKPIENIPIYLQTLWVRYWLPSTEPETTWMISDIDMFPISKEYFLRQIEKIDDNKYVHLNPCIDQYGTLPSCYHVAKGKKFTEVLELPKSWEESLRMVYDSNLGSDPGSHLAGKNCWFADERYANLKIVKYAKKWDLVFLERTGGQNGRRIDRGNWSYNPKLVEDGWYIDSHSIRPYNRYKKEIDKLVNLILKNV